VTDDVTFTQNLGNITIQTGESYTTGDINTANGNTLIVDGTLNVGNTGTGFLLQTGNNTTITVIGDLVVWGTLDIINNASIVVFGSITIKGDLDMAQNASLTIQAGSNIQVDGNFNIGNNGTVVVDGNLNVDGNINAGLQSDMSGNGTATNAGSCTGPAAFCIDSPLPVELIYFKVVQSDDINCLYWATSTEINNDHFLVQKSDDGIDFTNVTRIDGAGNSSQTIEYKYCDYQFNNGSMYYRLKQVDFDGNYEYSPIVFADSKNSFSNHWVVTPNPSSGAFVISIDNPEVRAKLLNFKLYSSGGRLLYQKNTSLTILNDDLTKLFKNESKGAFFLQIEDEFSKSTVRLIYQ
jgi:hypothetical protein